MSLGTCWIHFLCTSFTWHVLASCIVFLCILYHGCISLFCILDTLSLLLLWQKGYPPTLACFSITLSLFKWEEVLNLMWSNLLFFLPWTSLCALFKMFPLLQGHRDSFTDAMHRSHCSEFQSISIALCAVHCLESSSYVYLSQCILLYSQLFLVWTGIACPSE